MKRVKKLSYNERKVVESWGLSAEEWGKEKIVNGNLILRNYETSEVKEVPNKARLKC